MVVVVLVMGVVVVVMSSREGRVRGLGLCEEDVTICIDKVEHIILRGAINRRRVRAGAAGGGGGGRLKGTFFI